VAAALGDVDRHGQDARRPTQLDQIGVDDQRTGATGLDPKVCLEVADHAVVADPPEEFVALFLPLPELQVERGASDDFLAREPRGLEKRRIGLDDFSVGGPGNRHQGGARRETFLEIGARFPLRGIRPVALGDVAQVGGKERVGVAGFDAGNREFDRELMAGTEAS